MAGDERRRLVISEEDIADDVAAAPSAAPTRAPQHPSPPPAEGSLWAGSHPPPTEAFPAAQPRPPMPVGDLGSHTDYPPPAAYPTAGPPAAAGLNLNSVKARNFIAAAAGIAAGWAFVEITHFGMWDVTSESGANFTSGALVAALGLFFAVIYTGWEHIQARNLEGLKLVALKAAPVGAGLGFVSGFIAQVLYTAMLKNALEDISLGDIGSLQSNASLYLARVLAWGLFGMGMGAASAAAIRSRQKLVNGMIGGAIGGAVGGLVFHWASFNIESQTFSRLIGLMCVGVGIGLAIGLVETARREAWLHVVAGGMAGKEFILYEIETKVGSSPKCELTLIKEPAVQPFHFVISSPAGGRRTIAAYEGCAVAINGTPIAHHELRNGDVIGVGATSIAYSERAITP